MNSAEWEDIKVFINVEEVKSIPIDYKNDPGNTQWIIDVDDRFHNRVIQRFEESIIKLIMKDVHPETLEPLDEE